MQTGTVFENNRTQAVRLPVASRFPDTVKKVVVRKLGNDRIITPIANTWDSFFLSTDPVSGDFLVERASQEPQERESLDD